MKLSVAEHKESNRGICLEIAEKKAVAPLCVQLEGVGIHSGKAFRVEIFRAPAGQGIQFHGYFEAIPFCTPARWSRLSGTARSTALVMRGESPKRMEIRTIEHFMAAAFMSRLWDLDVYVTPIDHDSLILEMPILDGSALEWWKKLEPLRNLEFQEQATRKSERIVWRAKEAFEWGDGSKRVVIKPLRDKQAMATYFDCQSAFGDHWQQDCHLKVDWNQLAAAQIFFERHVAGARTFGFRQEIDALLARGLALGGSLDNALILDGPNVVNKGGLRMKNEIAAHKLMDAIGDFALLQGPLMAEISFIQAGHALHLRALEEAVRRGVLFREERCL